MNKIRSLVRGTKPVKTGLDWYGRIGDMNAVARWMVGVFHAAVTITTAIVASVMTNPAIGVLAAVVVCTLVGVIGPSATMDWIDRRLAKKRAKLNREMSRVLQAIRSKLEALSAGLLEETHFPNRDDWAHVVEKNRVLIYGIHTDLENIGVEAPDHDPAPGNVREWKAFVVTLLAHMNDLSRVRGLRAEVAEAMKEATASEQEGA